MQTVARILSAVLSVYMILIMIRIMLTWFRNQRESQFTQYLSAITDPYLNWFRRFGFLRTGMIDFSPILGFVLIGLLINLLNNFADKGEITLRSFIVLLLLAIWSIVSFLLVLFIILTLVRMLSLTLFKGSFLNQIAPRIDAILDPLVLRIKKLFFKKKFVAYTTQLFVTIAILILLNIALKFLFSYLGGLVNGIPF